MNIDEIINQLKDAKIPDLSNPDDHESSETFEKQLTAFCSTLYVNVILKMMESNSKSMIFFTIRITI